MFADFLDLTQPLWWTVDDVLSPSQCKAYIDRFEQGDAELAPIVKREGVGVDLEVRNNHRIMWDDLAEANQLMAQTRRQRQATHGKFFDTFRDRRLLCANPRLRVYRYRPGEKHGVHWDTEVEAEGGVSRVTLVVYLNDNFTGGVTEFPELKASVAPRPGRALVFQHRVLHEACEVTEGNKYVLRTDLIYAGS